MTAELELLWRAGKFVYPRGSDLPVHYMPLKDFSLERAQDYSLIVALRMARVEKQNALLEKYEIAKWRDTLMLDELVKCLAVAPGDAPAIVDIGGFNGVFLEELKAYCDAQGVRPNYAVWLPDRMRADIFQSIHGSDNWPYTVIATPGAGIPGRHILVVNDAGAIREGEAGLPRWQELLQSEAQDMVLAVRATDEPDRARRVTVRGREVDVPARSDVLALLSASGRSWSCRWLPRHDNDYFLPEADGAPVGLLLATSRDVNGLPGFRRI